MNTLQFFAPKWLKAWIIGLPVGLLAVYYFTVSADRYVSETIVTVRQANHEASALPGVAMLLGGVNPPSREDTLYLRQYVHSLAMLKKVDDRVNLKEHFVKQTKDPFYHLPENVQQELFLDFYRNRVEVQFDDVTSLLTLRVQSFDPQFSRRFAAVLLEECEMFVNAFSHQIAREQLSFAETELSRSADRLRINQSKALDFQNKNKLLDPTAEARASGILIAELQANLSRQETELRVLRSYLNGDAYQVQAVVNEISSIKKQLEIERTRSTTGNVSSDRLNQLAAEFRDLGMQVKFSEDTYRLALAAVENARIDATRKIKSLVVLEPPTLPEIALYPRKLYNLVTLLVVCILIYGLVRLVVTTVRDHQD